MQKKSKMSVQQRKYFVERISNTIDKQILNIRQQQAADVYDVSEVHYNKYLKALKVYKVFNDYKKCKERTDRLREKLNSIYDEVKRTIENPDADWRESQNYPNVWSSSAWTDFDKAFRFACKETAKKTDTTATHTKVINNLQAKKDRAIDELHGVNDFQDILGSVNKILKGTEVPKLGA